MKNRLHASAVMITILITSTMLAGVCTGRMMTDPTDMAGMWINPNAGMDMDMDMDMGLNMGMDVDVQYPTGFSTVTTSSDSSFTYGIAAGDLNGDCADDALIFNGTYNSSAGYYGMYVYDYVSAVNGRDGTELWGQGIAYETSSLRDLPAYPVGNIDGVAGDDVVMESCSYDSGTGTYTATMQVIQGSDGTELWNYSVTGNDQRSNASIHSYWYGDLVGGDLNDVVVVSQSYNPSDDTTTRTLRVMQGSNGEESWNVSLEGTMSHVDPCGDICGNDGKDDVVASCSFGTTSVVHVLHGSTGDESWNVSLEGTTIYVGPCGDLSGSDDGEDLVVWSEIYDFDTYKYTTATLHFLQSTDGHEFRNQSITGEHVSLTAFPADLDSDGNDLIVQSTSYNSTAGKYNCTICAVRGSDWHEFWSQSVTGDSDGTEAGASICAYPCDLDGDGEDEAIVDSWSYNSTTGDTTATVTVRDGDTSSMFGSDSISGPNASMSASSYGDLDGDGKEDVVVMQSCDSGAGNTTASVCVKKDNTNTVLWDDSVTGKGVWMRANCYASLYYQPDQDNDNDNLDDLLITTGTSVDRYINTPYGGRVYMGSIEIPTRVCAVKGADGTSLWCKSQSASSEPEPPVTGDLNGDDQITPVDAVIVLGIIASGDHNDAADVNGDGVTNSLDALMVMRAAIGAIAL